MSVGEQAASARTDQRRVPGLSRLFGDYLYRFESVAGLYPAGPGLDVPRLATQAEPCLTGYAPELRKSMAAALERQNHGAGEKTRALVRLFAQPSTVAIVTGQQVGIAGGPLLALYKAMTAVKLAEDLRARGVPAVPIFWMATEDHDLDEVNQIWILDGEARPVKLQAAIPAAANAPVGRLVPAPGSMAALAHEAARRGAVPENAIAELDASYPARATLAQGFAAMFDRWFAPWGLIVFDPMKAPEADRAWEPYYRTVAARQTELDQKLADRARSLEDLGYHAQVGSGSSLLFVERAGAREAAGASVAWERERVSAAALLRPVMQDVVFPTMAQVTGPAETAYLAQSAVLYQALGVRQPVAWPRASLTLVDARAKRLLEKYRLGLGEIWEAGGADGLERSLALKELPAGVEQHMTALRENFEQGFARLGTDLATLDPTLVDAAQGAAQKIKHQIEQMEARVARSYARRSGEVAAHARHLVGTLFPARELQERKLGAWGWTARYPNLPERLHAALEVETPDHQRLDL